jgi:peptide/nickel transport system ATP-binding protein
MSEADATPILEARNVVRRYPTRGGGGHLDARGRHESVVLDGVSLALRPGEILGLVGRSGAGKSTLARILLGLERADGGEVRFLGRPLQTLDAAGLRRFRRAIQVVFQDPHASLDPRHSLGSIVTEPLAVHELVPRKGRRERGARLMHEVGLPGADAFMRRHPRELSGGERQRVALARALACGPRALILDEPVSALDVSVRAQVLNLLLDLHRRSGLAMLLIAHDVRLVARLCNRVAVMAGGRIVEEGPPESVLASPKNRATAELVGAARWLST